MKLYTEKSAAGMESASCPTQQGSLPGVCAPLAFPYIPMRISHNTLVNMNTLNSLPH